MPTYDLYLLFSALQLARKTPSRTRAFPVSARHPAVAMHRCAAVATFVGCSASPGPTGPMPENPSSPVILPTLRTVSYLLGDHSLTRGNYSNVCSISFAPSLRQLHQRTVLCRSDCAGLHEKVRTGKKPSAGSRPRCTRVVT